MKQILSLDGHELFTQLVSQSNLVKIGPRNGLFSCFVEVEEGVVRVWRKWLREMAARNSKGMGSVRREDGDVDGKGKGKEPVRNRSEVEDDGILWVSPQKHTGIRFNIKERRLRRDVPILMRADEEDMPVSYEIEYDGKLCLLASGQSANTIGRALDPNFASPFVARKVHGARRQLLWQSCCVWLLWMT